MTTNPLGEQTYILTDETKECVIIDPGFYVQREKDNFITFMKNQQLTIVSIWFTHLHLDHMLGTQFILETYGKNIPTYASSLDASLTQLNKAFATSWGINFDNNITISNDIHDGDYLSFGNSRLKAINVPGHSQGSMVFYCEEQNFCVSGDVLFQYSIGRSDFPGGNEEQLIDSINRKLLTLPGETAIHPGHGQATTIDDERQYNPYIRHFQA